MEFVIRSEVPRLVAGAQVSALDDVEELVRVHRPRILRFVLLSVSDLDVAESITQDTFLKAYQTRERFRGDCKVATWLSRIAYNLICDYTRLERYKFWRHVSRTAIDVSTLAGVLPNRSRSAEDRVLARERLGQVLAAVQALSLQQRSVFTLHFIEELSVAEIGEVLDMQKATVKTHLYRALAKLRSTDGETA